MNGKKAKRLRRQAEAETVGKPAVVHMINNKTGQIVLGDCTRKRYKELKRGA